MSNNWIHKRHMRSGGSIGQAPKSQKALGPLREVDWVHTWSQSIFDKDFVRFVCGHDGTRSNGARRGRCRKCRQEELAVVTDGEVD